MAKKRAHKGVSGWTYTVGKQFLKLRKKDGKKVQTVTAPLNEVMNMTWDDIERGQRKRYFAVKPGHVAGYLKFKGLI
jgi:hypothetical protein